MLARPSANLMIEVPAFMALDVAHSDAIAGLYTRGNTLLPQGRPRGELPRDLLPCFKPSILDLEDERRRAGAVALALAVAGVGQQGARHEAGDVRGAAARLFDFRERPSGCRWTAARSTGRCSRRWPLRRDCSDAGVADRTTGATRGAVLRVQWPFRACSSLTVNAPHDPALERPEGPEAWHRVLDAACLQRLGDLDPGGRGGLVARVIRTYVQSLAKLLDQLTQARASGDPAALRHVAHTLKSSSASVGALDLSERCAEVERCLRDGGVPSPTQVDAMAREGERLLAALRPTMD